MSAAQPSSVAVFAAVFVALYAAHQVADHWVQTQHQAETKGLAGWRGRIACAAHVTTYGITGLIAIGLGAYAMDQSWHVGWIFVASLIIAG